MKVLIIRGNDRHTIRLISGLRSCGIYPDVISKPEELNGERYNTILVDPSFDYDIANKINCDSLGFFDTEDSHLHFDPKTAYFTLKDKVKFYTKMNYIDNDRNDNIKNIGFPLDVYPPLINIAKLSSSEINYETAMPFFVGTPTFIGNYKGISKKEEYEGISTIAYFDGESGKELAWNQRYQWLCSMRKNFIRYAGGIVFTSSNLAEDWQTKAFGNVSQLQHRQISREDYLKVLLYYCKIGLCPTGHDRMSWRLFDIMATGAVLIWTDNHGQKTMYNPTEYITIRDDEDLGSTLLTIQKDYRELWKSHQKNREVFSSLSIEKIAKDFENNIK